MLYGDGRERVKPVRSAVDLPPGIKVKLVGDLVEIEAASLSRCKDG